MDGGEFPLGSRHVTRAGYWGSGGHTLSRCVRYSLGRVGRRRSTGICVIERPYAYLRILNLHRCGDGEDTDPHLQEKDNRSSFLGVGLVLAWPLQRHGCLAPARITLIPFLTKLLQPVGYGSSCLGEAITLVTAVPNSATTVTAPPIRIAMMTMVT